MSEENFDIPIRTALELVVLLGVARQYDERLDPIHRRIEHQLIEHLVEVKGPVMQILLPRDEFEFMNLLCGLNPDGSRRS